MYFVFNFGFAFPGHIGMSNWKWPTNSICLNTIEIWSSDGEKRERIYISAVTHNKQKQKKKEKEIRNLSFHFHLSMHEICGKQKPKEDERKKKTNQQNSLKKKPIDSRVTKSYTLIDFNFGLHLTHGVHCHQSFTDVAKLFVYSPKS